MKILLNLGKKSAAALLAARYSPLIVRSKCELNHQQTGRGAYQAPTDNKPYAPLPQQILFGSERQGNKAAKG